MEEHLQQLPQSVRSKRAPGTRIVVGAGAAVLIAVFFGVSSQKEVKAANFFFPSEGKESLAPSRNLSIPSQSPTPSSRSPSGTLASARVLPRRNWMCWAMCASKAPAAAWSLRTDRLSIIALSSSVLRGHRGSRGRRGQPGQSVLRDQQGRPVLREQVA